MQPTEITEERELTFSFRAVRISLRLTITALWPFRTVEPEIREARGSTDLEAQTTDFVDRFEISFELEEQVLAAQGAAQFSELPLDFLQTYIGRLRSTNGQWSARARIGRALRAGIAAYRRLQGITCSTAAPSIPFRNSTYIILRSPSLPSGGWTADYSKFVQHIGRGRSYEFDTTTVCHGFPTQAEGDVYLIGARRLWPQLL